MRNLKIFIDQINKLHPAIKLTADFSKKEVSFLDLYIKLIN